MIFYFTIVFIIESIFYFVKHAAVFLTTIRDACNWFRVVVLAVVKTLVHTQLPLFKLKFNHKSWGTKVLLAFFDAIVISFSFLDLPFWYKRGILIFGFTHFDMVRLIQDAFVLNTRKVLNISQFGMLDVQISEHGTSLHSHLLFHIIYRFGIKFLSLFFLIHDPNLAIFFLNRLFDTKPGSITLTKHPFFN